METTIVTRVAVWALAISVHPADHMRATPRPHGATTPHPRQRPIHGCRHAFRWGSVVRREERLVAPAVSALRASRRLPPRVSPRAKAAVVLCGGGALDRRRLARACLEDS